MAWSSSAPLARASVEVLGSSEKGLGLKVEDLGSRDVLGFEKPRVYGLLSGA